MVLFHGSSLILFLIIVGRSGIIASVQSKFEISQISEVSLKQQYCEQ